MVAYFSDDVLHTVAKRLPGICQREVPQQYPRASVLLPLCHVDGVASVLLTKRSERVGTHKGQVSFPGGRRDPDDRDAIATALREAEEEVALPPSQVSVLGALPDVFAISQVIVTPIVGFIGDIEMEKIRYSEAEIDAVFAVSIGQLMAHEYRSVQYFGSRALPVFSAGPFPIWGLTAFILDEFLREGLSIRPTDG